MADIGRPTVFDEMTLQKLEGAFVDGASDELACFLAEISESSLYNYQKEHPEFLERKKYLKEQTKFQARKNIREAVKEGDLETTKWFLERKDKEYKPKSDVTTDDKPIPIYGSRSTISRHPSDSEDIPAEEEN